MNALLRRGVLAPGTRTRGVISWHGAAGETTASISYAVDMTVADCAWMRLQFSTPMPDGTRRQVDQRVTLTATRPGFGGARWWFVDDGLRVGCLYLPPDHDQFRSRQSCGLLYASLYRSG